ncbi:unnamed protein product [Phytophthora fragariaefolia]|uniref:Unnamed protein product n=1 Tax=Phytophthora fragariaefolia TaxID=1490495 RepID=A0A9W7CQH7_9STRA|nr:unnamed protein product [Phytophthora fragariaefolia]
MGASKEDRTKSPARPHLNSVFIVKEDMSSSTVRRLRKQIKKLSGPNGGQILRRDNKQPTNKEDAIRLCQVRERIPPEGGTVLLEGVLSVPFCGDSGATMSSMSEITYMRLKEECPDVECVEFEVSIPCMTVGGEVEVNRAVNVHMTLRTAAGPVSIGSPVQGLIVPGELEKFLIGKEVLASLGIDVDRDLEVLASQRHSDGPDEFGEPDVGAAPELGDELEKLVRELVTRAGRKVFRQNIWTSSHAFDNLHGSSGAKKLYGVWHLWSDLHDCLVSTLQI